MFDIIKDISRTKNGRSLNRSDFDEVYDKYMIQRWLTMNNPKLSERINISTNITSPCLDNREHFMLLSALLPKTVGRGKYIKKEKTSGHKKENELGFVTEYESGQKIKESMDYVYGKETENE